MPTMKNSGELIASISADLADNNAGLISAEDVRHNMEDTVFSINRIVCSGDANVAFPFYKNVRARQVTTGDASAGIFIAESGIQFPNWPVLVPGITNNTQIQPFPGVENLQHNTIGGLTVGNPHTQYYHVNGLNILTANFKAGNNWINASGYDAVGLKFVPVKGWEQEIYTSGTMRWSDNSTMSNGKGLAKAWVQFDASGVGGNLPVIRSYHNISGIIRLNPGKFKIVFNSGVFKDNNYVAIGTANATDSADSKEDFEVNTVGMVVREMVDSNPDLRSITCVIKDEAGNYSDAHLIDCVFFGYSKNEASGLPTPTVSLSATYTDP